MEVGFVQILNAMRVLRGQLVAGLEAQLASHSLSFQGLNLG